MSGLNYIHINACCLHYSIANATWQSQCLSSEGTHHYSGKVNQWLCWKYDKNNITFWFTLFDFDSLVDGPFNAETSSLIFLPLDSLCILSSALFADADTCCLLSSSCRLLAAVPLQLRLLSKGLTFDCLPTVTSLLLLLLKLCFDFLHEKSSDSESESTMQTSSLPVNVLFDDFDWPVLEAVFDFCCLLFSGFVSRVSDSVRVELSTADGLIGVSFDLLREAAVPEKNFRISYK